MDARRIKSFTKGVFMAATRRGSAHLTRGPPHHRGRWRYLAYSLGLLILCSSLIIYLLARQRILGERMEIRELARPAADLVRKGQIAFGSGAYSLRGYLLSGDHFFLDTYQAAAAEEAAAELQLRSLVERLSPELTEAVEDQRRLAAQWHEPVADMIARTRTPEELDELLASRDALHGAVLQSRVRLIGMLDTAVQLRLQHIHEAERLQFGVALLLALLSLGAAVVLANVRRRLRVLSADLRHRAAEAERERREKAAFLESAAEGIFGIDPAGRFTFLNPAGAALLGHAPNDVIGRDVHELIHHTRADGSKAPRESCAILAVLHGGRGARLEQELLWRKDGTGFTAECTASPIRSEHGSRGAVVTFTDITARKRAEQTLRRTTETLRTVIAESPLGIVVLDTDGKVRLWNSAAERMFGWRAEEVIGRPPPFVRRGRRREHRALLARAVRGEVLTGIQVQRWRKDGRQIDLSISVSPLREPTGQVTQIIGMLEDVTEWKQAAAALRESEERYRRLVELSPEAIAVQRRGRFIYVNPAGARLMGVDSPAELIGQRVLRFVHPDHVTFVRNEIRRANAAGRPAAQFEEKLLRTDGSVVDVETTAIPITFDGRPALQAIARDVTERKRSQAERERLLEESERRRKALESVTESRARLMRGFSHDVKNPLAAADGYLQLFSEGLLGELSQQQSRSIERIRDSIMAALRLIDDMLQIAQAEAAEILIERRPLELGEMVREIADTFHAQAAAKGLTLHIDDSIPCPPIVSDGARIRQIIGNLLSNAIKYTPSGRITVSLQPEVRRAAAPGTWVAVRVHDSGPGIPKTRQSMIFDEFTRLDPDASPGAGLGLAISSRIADALGGALTVDSEVGDGATFTLWLPVSAEGDSASAGHG
jgi:PAS domain S-box-containing protein